jgi:hypothetical protein
MNKKFGAKLTCARRQPHQACGIDLDITCSSLHKQHLQAPKSLPTSLYRNKITFSYAYMLI